jgi:hypothetical protein
MTKLKKPTARGPSPARKAERALGQKLNRKSKPPPDPALLEQTRTFEQSQPARMI